MIIRDIKNIFKKDEFNKGNLNSKSYKNKLVKHQPKQKYYFSGK